MLVELCVTSLFDFDLCVARYPLSRPVTYIARLIINKVPVNGHYCLQTIRAEGGSATHSDVRNLEGIVSMIGKFD